MNLPNRITLSRLLIVPLVIILVIAGHYLSDDKFYLTRGDYRISILYLVGGILFVVASLSDLLDGYLARKFHQVTNFGQFFDPIADKLLVNAVLVLFVWTSMVPVWVGLILILRDIWIDFTRILLAKKNVTLAANIWGKWKTAWEMIGLTLIFFASYLYFGPHHSQEYGWYNQVVQIPLYIATLISLGSGIDYFIQAQPILFGSKRVKRGKR